MSTFLLILKAVLVILPLIVQMVRDGKIKAATEKEVLDAFEEEFEARWAKRIQAARDAGSASDVGGSVSNDGMPNDESFDKDPNDRSKN